MTFCLTNVQACSDTVFYRLRDTMGWVTSSGDPLEGTHYLIPNQPFCLTATLHFQCAEPSIDTLYWASSSGDSCITIARCQSSTTDVPGGNTGPFLALAPPVPNPSSHGFVLSVTMPHAAQVLLQVVDISGRNFAVLHQGLLAAGEHTFGWGSGGVDVPAGVYWLALTTEGRRLTRPVVVIR
jgi:hypothetical protein